MADKLLQVYITNDEKYDFLIKEKDLNKLNKYIYNTLKKELLEYKGCPGCGYCCYGYEPSKEYCETRFDINDFEKYVAFVIDNTEHYGTESIIRTRSDILLPRVEEVELSKCDDPDFPFGMQWKPTFRSWAIDKSYGRDPRIVLRDDD